MLGPQTSRRYEIKPLSALRVGWSPVDARKKEPTEISPLVPDQVVCIVFECNGCQQPEPVWYTSNEEKEGVKGNSYITSFFFSGFYWCLQDSCSSGGHSLDGCFTCGSDLDGGSGYGVHGCYFSYRYDRTVVPSCSSSGRYGLQILISAIGVVSKWLSWYLNTYISNRYGF